MGKLKTAEEAKAEIKKRGLTIAKWAVANGIQPAAVYALLKGRHHGNYGDAHKAAVLLGMKEGEINESDERMRA